MKNILDGKVRNYGLQGKDSSLPPRMRMKEEVFEYKLDSTSELLDAWCAEFDFVFNFVGVNRPQNQEEFMAGNFGFASTLLGTLRELGITKAVRII